MTPLAIEIIGTIALLAGLMVLWAYTAAGMVFAYYAKQIAASTAWLAALLCTSVAFAALLSAQLTRLLDWLLA